MAEQQLRVRLLALTQGFNQNMAAAQSRLTAFGTKAKQVGASLRSIQLPLALASGAAVKMAVDFDKSMTQIKSLVGVAGAEVDAMGKRAKRMAADTGQSANSAAEALFFITSAGLRGEEAMQVLEASLKAAAVGLGETKTVADLATSAMNAYGSDVLSASNATDILVSAVREGKLEASALAGSMGSVLPIASAMGVRFDEVGAAFAALSRTGTNAAEAATQIRGILLALLKPTTAAQKALSEMGLSSQGLRQQIREKGLLSALETLKKSFEGNDDATQAVFGNVRALLPIYDLLGANVQTTRDIFDSMTQSAGATEKAFKATSESASFQLTKSLNEAKLAFTEMGAVILTEVLPLIQDLSKFIVDLFKDFSSLDENTKIFILTLGGIVIVAPTVISAIGSITAAVAALSKGLMSLAASNPVIAALAALGFLGVKAADELTSEIAPDVGLFERLKIAVQGLIDPLSAVNNLIGAQVAASDESKKATEDKIAADKKATEVAGVLIGLQDKLNKQTTTATAAATGGGGDDAFEKFLDLEQAILDADKAVERSSALDLMTNFTFAEQSASVEYFGNVVKRTAEAVRQPFENIQEQINELSNETINLGIQMAGALRGAFTEMFEGKDVLKSLGDAILDLIKQLMAAAAASALVAAIISAITGTPFAASFNPIFSAASGINIVGSSPPQMPRPQNFYPPNSNNINLSGQFRLDGQDLVVAVERANKARNGFI